MSYVSGFMMGAAIGKGIRQFFGGNHPAASHQPLPRRRPVPHTGEVLVLVSSLPGRRRYRAEYISEALARSLTENLARLDFIRSIEVNALSGSILFCFDEADALKIDDLVAWLKEHIFKKPSQAARMPQEDGLPDESHAGSVTRSIRSSARALSAWIKRNTGGMFDMSSLASLMFGLRGLRKMILTQSSPTGAQMLWWALSLMRGWRTV